MNKPLIRDIVQNALTTGHLSMAAEAQLRQLLQTTKYSGVDLWAFQQLQIAVMKGLVQQQSRQRIDSFKEAIAPI